MKQVLITAHAGETRAALIEKDWITEFFLHRDAAPSLRDHIFCGRVIDHHKGLNRALVDIGLKRDGFVEVKNAKFLPPVGQKIIVQSHDHGAAFDRSEHALMKLSLNVSLAHSCLIFMPHRESATLSAKASQGASELSDLLDQLTSNGFCGIVRNQASATGQKAVLKQWDFLQNTWAEITQRFEQAEAPCQLYAPSHLIRWLDLLSPLDEIYVDNTDIFKEVTAWKTTSASQTDIIRPKVAEQGFPPDVEDGWQSLFDRHVEAEHGTNLIIDEVAAGSFIDVNSGSHHHGSDAEQTFLKANLAAATECARQIRLRGLKGLILIDFITMKPPHHRKLLEQKLRALIKHDPHGLHLHGITHMGLAELTREGQFPSLSPSLLAKPVATKSVPTVAYEILRACALHHKGLSLAIYAQKTVIDYLEAELRSPFYALKAQKNVTTTVWPSHHCGAAFEIHAA